MHHSFLRSWIWKTQLCRHVCLLHIVENWLILLSSSMLSSLSLLCLSSHPVWVFLHSGHLNHTVWIKSMGMCVYANISAVLKYNGAFMFCCQCWAFRGFVFCLWHSVLRLGPLCWKSQIKGLWLAMRSYDTHIYTVPTIQCQKPQSQIVSNVYRQLPQGKMDG